MARVTYPASGKTHRGFVGRLRTFLSEVASFTEKSPDAVEVVTAQIAACLDTMGADPIIPAGAALVADGQSAEVTVSGTWVDTVTYTVVDGAVTEIVLS